MKKPISGPCVGHSPASLMKKAISGPCVGHSPASRTRSVSTRHDCFGNGQSRGNGLEPDLDLARAPVVSRDAGYQKFC